MNPSCQITFDSYLTASFLFCGKAHITSLNAHFQLCEAHYHILDYRILVTILTSSKDSTKALDKSVTVLTLFPQKTIHSTAGVYGYTKAFGKTLVRKNGFEQVSICFVSDFYAEKLSYVLKFFITILHGQRLTIVLKTLPVNLFFHC